MSDFTKEELALGNRLFDVQPDSPWTAFCELRKLFGSMSLERMQELYDVVAKQRVVSDADLQAALPEYKGWQSSYVYPGFISYTHPDSDVMVCASSDFNGDGKLDIQIQTTGGRSFDDGENAPWPHDSRTASKVFDRLRPYLDKYHPSATSNDTNQGCPWTTGGDENGVGAVRCGRPTTHRCDNAPDTCARHKSSCCVPKQASKES